MTRVSPPRSGTELRLKAEFERARAEIARLKADLDRDRRQLRRLKQEQAEALPNAAAAGELEALRSKVVELAASESQLNALYTTHVEDSREHARRMQQMLESLGQMNAGVEVDAALARIAETIRSGLGYGTVLLYIREPGTSRLRARALRGASGAVSPPGEDDVIEISDVAADLGDAFTAGRSILVSRGTANPVSGEGKTGAGRGRTRFGRLCYEERPWRSDDRLLVPLFDGSGELVAFFSVGEPVDRRVPSRGSLLLLEGFAHGAVMVLENARICRELELQRRRLEESEQRVREMLGLRNRFLARIAHELRCPHTAIQSYLDTLLTVADGEIPPERLKGLLANLRHETQWLGWLTDCIADLSRGDSGILHLESPAVDLTEVAEDTVRLLENAAEAGHVTLRIVREAEDPRLHADGDQMRHLLLHLGSNAVKFTPPEGAVTLRILANAESVTVRVEDTGVGIPERVLERIFDRPYGVDFAPSDRGGRRGLGLAMVKAIAEWHGGRVSAESLPGKGSCFTVVMPRRTGFQVLLHPEREPHEVADELARLVVQMVAEVINARVVSLMMPDQAGDFVIRAATGLDEAVVRDTRVQAGKSPAGWVAEHRRPMCVARPGEVRDARPSRHKEYRSGTFISVPLETSHGLLGVLNVTDPVSGAPFDAEDCHLVLQLTQRIALAWERMQRAGEGPTSVEDTAHTLRELLRPIENERPAAPERSRLAREVARELGLSESEVGVISFAAGLAEVSLGVLREEAGGRMGPVALDGQVTDEGFAADAGRTRPLHGLGVVRDVLASQHEWWDGTGYPRGLEGAEIPLGGRVLAAINAYEALTQAGSPKTGSEAADVAMARLSGGRLDPQVAVALGRVLARHAPPEETFPGAAA